MAIFAKVWLLTSSFVSIDCEVWNQPGQIHYHSQVPVMSWVFYVSVILTPVIMIFLVFKDELTTAEKCNLHRFTQPQCSKCVISKLTLKNHTMLTHHSKSPIL